MYELFAPIHGLIQKGLELALDFDVPSLIAAGVFYALGTVALLGAMGVVFFRNVVHSALSLTASFIGIGGFHGRGTVFSVWRRGGHSHRHGDHADPTG